jgi:hypothetical protein
MIVALARKLIIALWRYANDGVIPEGFRLHSAYASEQDRLVKKSAA